MIEAPRKLGDLYVQLSRRLELLEQRDRMQLDRQKQQDKLVQSLLRYLKLKAAHDPEYRLFKFMTLEELLPPDRVDRWNTALQEWQVRYMREDFGNGVPKKETAKALGISVLTVSKYHKKFKADVRPN